MFKEAENGNKEVNVERTEDAPEDSVEDKTASPASWLTVRPGVMIHGCPFRPGSPSGNFVTCR